jgi:hypothetical protein
LLFVFIQNICNKSPDKMKTHTCVLSRYTNEKCGQDVDNEMHDLIYYLGLKKNYKLYETCFNLFTFILIVHLICKIKNH